MSPRPTNHLADGKLKAREIAKMDASSERSLWRKPAMGVRPRRGPGRRLTVPRTSCAREYIARILGIWRVWLRSWRQAPSLLVAQVRAQTATRAD